MDNFISILRDAGSPEELEAYKVALFKENVRIRTDLTELEEKQDSIRVERKKLEDERKSIEKARQDLNLELEQVKRELANERKRLEEDTVFFEKKQHVLERAFKELDADRKAIEYERIQLRKFREDIKNSTPSKYKPIEYKTGVFFKGVKNELELKKRYKDLLKIYHPDNLAGDNEVLQVINKEYELLKHEMNTWK